MGEPNAQDEQTWMEQGQFHLQCLNHADALDCFTHALNLNPNNPETWLNRGTVLQRLGCYSEAMLANANAQKLYTTPTLTLNPPSLIEAQTVLAAYAKLLETPEYWFERGNVLYSLERYGESIASYDKALNLKPDNAPLWNNRGLALAEFSRYEEAIASYDEALKLVADLPESWYNRGLALYALSRNEDAIASFNQALALKPNYTKAQEHRHLAVDALALHTPSQSASPTTASGPAPTDAHPAADLILPETTQDAIATPSSPAPLSSPAPPSPPASTKLIPMEEWSNWEYRGLSVLYEQNYLAALAVWDEGIQTLQAQPTYDSYGCSKLYYRKGLTQYREGCIQTNPMPHWIAARESYSKGLSLLSNNPSPSQPALILKLEIFQESLKVCHQLGIAAEPQAILQQSTNIFMILGQDPTLTTEQRIELEHQFAGFKQLQVDILARQNPEEAIELAEVCRNRSLGRLRQGWNYQPPPLDFDQLQTVLHPTAAAIYWHLSPAALTTFIIKANQPPQILQSTLLANDQQHSPELKHYPPAAYQLRCFNTWMQQWKQNYRQYRDPNPAIAQTSPWQHNMEWMLVTQLRAILDIPNLCQQHLQDVDQLVLIPHRDLHLLPLHILFPGRFTITYLPSIQVGLDLQKTPTTPITRLLSIEAPPLPSTQAKSDVAVTVSTAQLESAAVTQPYGKVRSLMVNGQSATKDKVIAALKIMSEGCHFTGYGFHNLEAPGKSALTLAGGTVLTLQDIYQMDLHAYQLICLPACETGLAKTQTIRDEYVGLISGFLAAGVSHVVSSLWTVNDMSSTFLMIRLHQLLKQNLPVWEALSTAQRWLRTLTYGNLIPWVQSLSEQFAKNNPGSSELELLQFQINRAKTVAKDQGMDGTPYAHPFYWAGFIVTGKVPEAVLAPTTIIKVGG